MVTSKFICLNFDDDYLLKCPRKFDPDRIIDSIDSFYIPSVPTNVKATILLPASSDAHTSTEKSDVTSPSSLDSIFDPVDFLNYHFKTESELITALPSLRSKIASRLSHLDESISSKIQKQSDLADVTLLNVSRAKTSILTLHRRIDLLQSKARLSERAVLEITRDMKRLDYAKRHLSLTITALKRLHMLLHAVSQLEASVDVRPYPDYAAATNLLDATKLLLGHFEQYMITVPDMRALKDRVELVCTRLKNGVILAFRIVAFGIFSALEMEGSDIQNVEVGKKINGKLTVETKDSYPPPMPPCILSVACNVFMAFEKNAHIHFLDTFCSDHLLGYEQLFNPRHSHHSTNIGISLLSSSSFNKSSFIKRTTPNLSSSILEASQYGCIGDTTENTDLIVNSNPASLDQVEKRYSWYRDMLRVMEENFPRVFPLCWNIHHFMTLAFLNKTGRHFKLMLSSDNTMRDRDCENVTILLKALQKTILFEKEMTSWLEREYGTVFSDHFCPRSSVEKCKNSNENRDKNDRRETAAMHNNEKRCNKRVELRVENLQESDPDVRSTGNNLFIDNNDLPLSHVPVLPLIGVASGSFDGHMGPYIALEKKNMNEQITGAASNNIVDSCGKLSVFTSSTRLFLYIKNSITRCTILTNGSTFYMMYLAFKDTLRKYSQVMLGKYPPASLNTTAAISGITIAGVSAASLTGSSSYSSGSSNIMYRITPGDETIVCHVIGTCEYCVGTVEALQDLIADKIDSHYRGKIDMEGEIETFHDVAAKGIFVLMSGLVHRIEPAIKEMTGINWAGFDMVGEESKYVRYIHDAIHPFVSNICKLLPGSYFRSFCDKFAATFTSSFYSAIVRCKRINEAGTQQLLLDVYNLKTLMLKLPVIGKKSIINEEKVRLSNTSVTASSIAPVMYSNIVMKQFQNVETLLKLVGTPSELLIGVFKVQWVGGTAIDLQTVMNLKGMKRYEQSSMIEKFGAKSLTGMRCSTLVTPGTSVTENIQSIQDRSTDVASRVNSDLSHMRQKVEDFRKAFR